MSRTSARVTHLSGALTPPPGVTPNLDNPEDHLYTVNIVGLSVCLGLNTIFFALRCYARYRLALTKTAEDWSCQIAFALATLYIATGFIMAHYGEGHYLWEITPENYKQILKWLYASSIVWIPAAFFVKASLLLLTARVFAVYRRAAKAIRLYVWFLLLAYLPVEGFKIFICTPIKRFWDPSVPGRCPFQTEIFLTDTAIAIVTDLLILLIPISLIWKLHMPLRKKLKIVAMLGAGGAAVAVTCYREYKIYKFQWSTDVTGDLVVINLCGTIELTIGMVCACLPPINLLVEKWRRPTVSRNHLRTRFWPSGGTWHVRKRSKVLKAPSFLSTTIEYTPNRADGDADPSSGRGVDSGDATKTSLNQPNSAATSQAREAGNLHRLELQELLRYDSQDGRREGWLTRTPVETSESAVDDIREPAMRQAQVTMEQLRQGGQDVLIPDRIWDGVRRGL